MAVEDFEEARYSKNTPLSWRQRVASEVSYTGKVLDLGCGDGLFMEFLKKKGCDVKGVDISPKAVERCIKKGLDAVVLDFDGKDLPFENGQFDTVVMLDVLEHLYFPLETLREANRVAKRVVLVTPNFASIVARLQAFFGFVPNNNVPKKGHVQWVTYCVLKRWLKKSGWVVSLTKGNYYLQQMPLISFFIRLLGRLFPSLFTTAFLIVAVKRN